MENLRPDPIQYLTGKLSDKPFPNGISIPGGGEKFNPDGSVQIWPGNTFICHIPKHSTAFQAICEMQEEIKKSQFHRFYTFLPTSSLHMTVMQGTSPSTSDNLTGGFKNLPNTMSRDQATGHILEMLKNIQVEQQFKVKFVDLFAGNSITLTGVDEYHEAKLRETRQTLSNMTTLNDRNFNNYTFHCSLGYLLDWVSESTAKEIIEFSHSLSVKYAEKIGIIELGPVEFCNFDSMHHFEPIKILTNN